MDFNTMTNEDLTAALAEKRTAATALFALDAPTVAQADEAEALMASIGQIEAEQTSRAAVVADAAQRFAAARDQFSATAEAEEVEEDEEETEEVEPEDDDVEEEAEETEEVAEVEAAAEPADEDEDQPPFEKKKKNEDEVTTASAAKSQRFRPGAAKAAAATKNARPAKAAAAPVTITAAADIPGVHMGSSFSGMSSVAGALKARGRLFPKHNESRAEKVAAGSNGAPVLNRVGLAEFNLNFNKEMVAEKPEGDYNAVKAAREDHLAALTASVDRAKNGGNASLTAAGWCAPSPYVYNWIADFVVDGLLTLPEVSAPRGGLQITEGPQLAQTTYAGDLVDGFGFGGTEAEMEAGYVKTCETIVCPEFEDHRLDFVGYCFKIPFLTEHAYPELIADALRLSDVLYAHKMNRRFIRDVVAASTAINATNALGASMLDTLEAFTQVATKERRWWNLGENALMEVKLPQVAKEIFKFDMARRSGLALTDIATEQKVAAHFANQNLAVEYVSDWQDRHGQTTVTADWPATIKGLIYPAGTFAKAVEDVIRLDAVHDAASLSANEYTGVFMEQGVMTLKLGYRSHVIEVAVCTAGVTGANALDCVADVAP